MKEFTVNHPGIMFTIILVLVLGAIVAYYGNFTATIVRWSKKPSKSSDGKVRQPKLTLAERVPCYIPIFQVYLVRKTLYGSARLSLFMAWFTTICLVTRGINTFLLPINEVVLLVTAIGAYVGLFSLLLFYALVTASTARTYGFGFVTVLLSFVLAPIGAWLMTTAIPNKMRALHKEDIFNEHKSDTIVKRRYN